MIYVILSYIFSPAILLLAAMRKKNTVKNILVIQTAKIGDMICSTPVFREIKMSFPKARLTAIVSPVTKKLLLNNPHIDEIFSLDAPQYKGLAGRMRLAGLIRRGRYDIAVCLNPNVPFAFALFWGLVPVRLTAMPDHGGLTFKMASLLFTHLEEHARGRLLAETYMKMIEKLGVRSTSIAKEIYESDAAAEKAAEVLGGTGARLIGIALSSGNKMKELGDDKIAVLSERILKETNAVIVFIGSASDAEAAEDIIRPISEKERVINAVGRLGLDELPALIRRLSLFIGVDTGITYMADALSIPLIDIAGPSDMSDQRPTGRDAVIIRKDLPCVPCSHAFKSPYICRLGTRECITSVSAEEIFSAAAAILNRVKD